MEKTKLTVLVNSCDAFSDCWEPFFKLFDIYGGDLKDLEIVLNTETLNFEYPGLNIRCVHSEKGAPWGKRVKNALKQIETPYVLTLLEDFFIRRDVDTCFLQKCVEWLDSDNRAGVFNFDPTGLDKNTSRYLNCCIVPPNTPWRCNAQAAIWRKDVLYTGILDVESPWEWEQKGTLRNNVILKDVDFYTLRHHTPMPIEYGLSKTSDFGVLQGKWHKSDVVPLFEKHGIKIDYSVRGFCEENVYEDKSGIEPDQKRGLIKFAADITRPFRNHCAKHKRPISPIDEALIYEPIRQWKNHTPGWTHIDYKKGLEE